MKNYFHIRPINSVMQTGFKPCFFVCRKVICLGAALILQATHLVLANDIYTQESDSAKLLPEGQVSREHLPLYKTIPAPPVEEMTAANGWPPASHFEFWHRSHGDPGSTRFSAVDQINRDNVKRLQPAWTYHSNDQTSRRGRNIQANPIVVENVLYGPTVGNALVALDATTGEELWRFHPEEKIGGAEGESTAQRGLVYWEGDANHASRLLFNAGRHCYCLDPKTGRLIESFGTKGRTRTGIIATAGAIYKNVITLPSKSETAVFGYDIITGRQVWRFNTVPQPGDRHFDPNVPPHHGARGWGGIALDESRGLVFLCFGNPRSNQGISGPINQSLYANSVVALRADTGEYVWHFQEIRHDIWDLDIPAPPILVTVNRNGKQVDAVAALTKLGNTLLLDRVTGRPLFDFRLRRAPASRLKGVNTWPYQPDVQLPQPFAKQEFRLEDVTDRSPEARAHVMDFVKKAHFGWFEPYQKTDQPVIFYGIHGGAEWTGGCFDPISGMLFVSANEIPWSWTATEFRETSSRRFQEGHRDYLKYCASCHGPERLGVGVAPSLIGMAERYSDRNVMRAIIKNGFKTMAPIPGIQNHEIEPIINYLYAEGEPPDPGEQKYVHTGMGKLQDHEGLPGTKPPWGTLVAINLNSGLIQWRVPLGKHPEMPAATQPTGTENFGGPSVSAGGLVFCAGTRDHLIRAFNSETGEELWRHPLPFGGYAPPTIYSVDGKQFIVIAATSGGKLGGELGDAYMAFSLPEE